MREAWLEEGFEVSTRIVRIVDDQGIKSKVSYIHLWNLLNFEDCSRAAWELF